MRADLTGDDAVLREVRRRPAEQPKRDVLTKMTNWPTLPKVFIDDQFYGDTDVLDLMEKKGGVERLLKKVCGK
jgi:monothiol glutaredoxin